ncbi:MAG: hypothetical protein DDT37_01900 [Firmicutes bacterium]|nr:hypothetical protein [candidate division NPL-UPA2 bacterium]
MSIDGLLRARRDAARRLIAENPVEVKITQTTFVVDGAGGRMEQTHSPASFVGRLLPTRLALRQLQDEAGARQAKEWLLLAPSDVVVHAGDSRFVVAGVTYRIKEVVPRRYRGEIYVQHIVLEGVT